MSFETDGISDPPFPLDHDDTLAGFDGLQVADAYTSTEILPTGDAPVDEQEPFVPDVLAVAELPPTPIKFKNVHFIGGQEHEGAHPDSITQTVIEQHEAAQVEKQAKLTELLAAAPNYNAQCADAIETAVMQLAADFGHIPPITVVDKRLMPDIADIVEGINPASGGLSWYGRIIVATNDRELAMYGPGVVRGTILHEGAHESAGMVALTVTRDGHVPNGRTAYGVEHVRVNGLLEHDPDPQNALHAQGWFWEEGFCEAYRVRRDVAQSLEVREPGFGVITYADGTRVGFAAPDAPVQNVDPLFQTMFVPWRYAAAAMPLTIGGCHVLSSETALPAYAIDLLDRRLPGLYGDILESRHNPDIIPRIKEQINSVEPGLYERQAHLPCSPWAFAAGLAHVVRALGVANKPVI
jgi:hypothetical protein